MVREIKATLALDGEKKFSAQIKEAQRNLRVMRSDLKAEASAFEANGQKMQANEARVKSLRKQQEQQKRIIQALEGAVADSAKAYGEASSQADGYRIKLANAKAELAKMEAAEKTAIAANQKATKSVKELKQEIGKDWKTATGKAEDALKGMGTVAAGVFTAVSVGAAAAGKSIYDWAVDAAHDADDLLTLALQSGVDEQTLQGWQYAANFVDVGVDDILGSVKRLRKNMTSESEDIQKAFLKTGVSLTDEAGNYRDAVDVFWDVVDAIHADPTKYGNETETDNLLQTLFGKGYDELLPLIKQGRETWDSYVDEAFSKDLVMDPETVRAFGEFNDILDKISANYSAIHRSVAMLFLPDIATIGADFEELTTKFNQFLNGDATAEDVAEAAANLVADVVRSFENGVGAMNEIIAGLQSSDDPNVQAIGNLLAGIRDAAIELYDRRDDIKKGLEAIAGIWITAKIGRAAKGFLDLAGAVGSLVKNGSELIKKGVLIGKAAEAAAGGVPGSTPASTPGRGSAMVNGAKRVAKNIASGAAAVALPAAVLAGGIALNYQASKVYIESGQAEIDFHEAQDSPASSVWRAMQGMVENMSNPNRTPESGAAAMSELEKSFIDTFGDIRGKLLLDSFMNRFMNYQTDYNIENGGFDMNVLPLEDLEDILAEGYELIVPAQFRMEPSDDSESGIQAALDGMHLTAPLALVPTVGGFNAGDYRAPFGMNVGGNSYANVSLNLDGRMVGHVVAPIVNEELGRRFRP